MILVWSRKAIVNCAHEGVVGRRKSQWTTDFSQNSGTYIIYNSHVTCSNSSFSLTMVTPTSHFFAFRWLCCLFPIGYIAQAHFCGRAHLPPSPNSTTSIGQGHILIITLLILFSTGCSCLNIHWYTAPVGMVTFRQSPCWYYLRPDAAVSTSADTQHLWAWWHFGNHLVDIIPSRMQLSQHPLIHSTCGHGNISAITLLILSPAGCRCLNIHWYTAPVGMVTFRQSPCWYYLRPDADVSTSVDTQHLWAWWHSSDHSNLINVSVKNIRCIHTSRSH